MIKYWNLINTKLIDSIINIYSWILSFYLKLNCEYVAVPNIEFSNEEIIYFFLFQEINSKKISEVFESNSLLVDMEQKVIHKGN